MFFRVYYTLQKYAVSIGNVACKAHNIVLIYDHT